MERFGYRPLVRTLWPYLALWFAWSLLVGIVTLSLVDSNRDRELNNGKIESENLARILQHQTTRMLEGFDLTLSMLKATHERAVGDVFLAPLAASIGRASSTDVERVFNRFDATGLLVASSNRDAPIGKTTIADRAYFIDARDRPGDGIRVGAPVTGRVSGTPVIPLVKRLDRIDGRFDGVMSVALDPSRLVKLFRSLRIGESSSVGIMNRDGRIYVWSGREDDRALPTTGVTDAGPRSDSAGSVPSPAILRFADVTAPGSVVSVSDVPGSDLVAFAALSEDQILADHRVVMKSLAGYAALIVAALTLSVALLSRRALDDARRRHSLELRYEDARERARTDPLTGAANREAFDGHLRHAHRAAEVDRAPFVLAFLDIDRFKALNDRFGHDTGDRALRRVADTIAGHVRRADVVARLGGDEFAVLMPGADRASCLRVFDNLRETLRLVTSEEGWPISFSVGVVAFESAPARPRDAISLADRLMYDVKRTGRDGIRFATFRDGNLVVDSPKVSIAA